jgi:hypothetical protein
MKNQNKQIICLSDIKSVPASALSQGAQKDRRSSICLGDIGSLAGSVLSQGGKKDRRSSKKTKKIASRIFCKLRKLFKKP